ncbi:MAG TPA: energy transducer TonB [Bacteroidia bacterium]|nr:energy transducer TonB [Bacteroidia bacterium]
MIILENNAALLNDIVFKSRNKNYGAYVIRNEYGNTILKSLGVTILFFAAISLLAFWLNNTAEIEKKIELATTNILPPIETYSVEMNVTPVQKRERVAISTPPPVNNANTTEVSTNINDNAVEHQTDPIQTNEATSNANTQTGNPDAAPGTGTGNNPTGEVESPGGGELNSPATTMPDVLPSFENMAAFLQKNLKYPELAKEENVSGKVVINFIVNEEGKVVSVTPLNRIGYGCDEEALRVVRLMQNWKPGMVKGKPVKVSFSLPIVFKLQ